MTLETFKIEVLPLKDKLYRLANRLLRNIPEAEDTVQEVFLRLWARREKLEQYRSIEAFAMTITKNLCLDKLKSKKNKTDELTISNQGMNNLTPYKSIELSESVKNVQRIINTLPEQQRMIVQLRDVEGYEFEEISEVLQLSVNTIRVNLSRARKKIRSSYLKTYNYEFAKN